jgi:hypothetical protein
MIPGFLLEIPSTLFVGFPDGKETERGRIF